MKHALRAPQIVCVRVCEREEGRQCVWAYAWDHEAEQHWGPKAASESFCRAVFFAAHAGWSE